MSIPTISEEYTKLMDHLRCAQENAAMIAHLHNANDRRGWAVQWLKVSENFRKLQDTLMQLAQGRLN